MKWFPLCNYTHYSLQKGFSKPKNLAKKCSENSYPACGIADYKSISGAISFYQACINKDIKPIIGCSFDGFTLFAKNKQGWLDLIELVSSIDTDGVVDKKLLSNTCSRKNLICIAEDQSKSPIKGEDFYVKSDSFMDIYYAEKEHAPLHRITLCSGMKTTLPKTKKALSNKEDVENSVFFESNDFYLKDRAEISKILVHMQ